MPEHTDDSPPGVNAGNACALYRLIGRFCAWFGEEKARRRIGHGRHRLPTLSNRMLDDIGISREEAEIEALRNDLGAARMESLAKKKYLTKMW